ncbi:hypothetical protein ALO95_200125 [Pseudomonas syringae pv. antirrhini]|uniref:SnoaL-like domain-containing protein n=1 Tax=Pseudomonas syringae pv. antirrhini TaxID=251702 RepID=A0A0P9KBG7_9PSED|nr:MULTISPECIES: nuclear transport factor 2 family protein [Pseudomonas]KPW52701.1 hypothetical protein ALO88_00035 [Pseudomonas syringae pv. antirrhini]RMP32146.1 hypothetical protein ALQ24_03152 [Pseudomonas syringae pv. antirrhini]RMP42514.1 hypothetical protein ALQ23_200366 [Pseudomonas syringae pv. antirrhini]RMW23491.1 hypothetical protein ALO95_200125 [Pseudomonas syringae pv. antirrhini]WIN08812.1 nuclear transport factor 2 family protein [Pseudomonas syringae pv. antirrhini str. 126]
MNSFEHRREAESQIARLIHTYLYRLDEGDLEAVADFFDEATWHITSELAMRGKAEKLAWLREHTPTHDAHLGPQHLIGNILIDVSDDGHRATSVSYFLVSQLTEGSAVHLAARGRYVDGFVLHNSRWRFTERHVHIDRH